MGTIVPLDIVSVDSFICCIAVISGNKLISNYGLTISKLSICLFLIFRQTLSAQENERLFATFAIQIALDSTDIKDRLEKQKEACEKQHRRLMY